MRKTNWVWIPDWSVQDDERPAIVYFRKSFDIEKMPEELILHISADSRYKLYVNGKLVQIGPCKGDNSVWFYDTVNIVPDLTKGKNVLAVVVLRYPMDTARGNDSVFRTDTPGLYVDCEDDFPYLSADESWKCVRNPNVMILPENAVLSHLYIKESVQGTSALHGWEQTIYQDDSWESAKPLGWEIIRKFNSGLRNLLPRPIPPMNLIPRYFYGIQELRKSASSADDWNRMLHGNGSVCIPANAREVVEINAGELMTGFLKLAVSRGAGAEIQILQAESYFISVENGEWKKADRTDSKNGQLQGFTDTYKVAGAGSWEDPEVYEPFWFRTFRFVRLEITTREQPLIVKEFSYLETGYPLKVQTTLQTSDESLTDIWNISLRTLKRCMHETYMDCPYYEQMQYVMDTRVQILYTYAVSADDRLARKCFADFRRSQRYDGMISCCYPDTKFSVIPGFAIYYILMLHDHMMYFGDQRLVRSYLPSVDAVLDYFDSHLAASGMLDKLGGRLFADQAWSFIDWAPQWDATGGMPPAGLQGPITMESLLYILGLERAAQMTEYVGRKDTAEEYRRRAEKVRQAVQRYCIGENGMIQDGPGIDQYSQHCQVFGALTDIVSEKQARRNLQITMEHKDEFPQCTVAMAYYLFRALEKCGLYDYTERCWDVWREMLRNHLTTCVEEPLHQRSDCHAWGALALYELPSVILGVRPTAPGFADFEVKPLSGYLAWAKGSVVTPKGLIEVQWKKNGEKLEVTCRTRKVSCRDER